MSDSTPHSRPVWVGRVSHEPVGARAGAAYVDAAGGCVAAGAQPRLFQIRFAESPSPERTVLRTPAAPDLGHPVPEGVRHRPAQVRELRRTNAIRRSH
jgi:hypothetical protein